MTVEVRRARDSDREAIARFVTESYGEGAPYKGGQRFEWQFLSCPFKIPGGIPMWVAVDGGRVVGHIGAQGTEVWLDGHTYPGAWLLDLMVSEEYRGQSLGQRLYHAARDCSTFVIAINMADASRRIGLREGCMLLGEVPRYTRLVRPTAQAVKQYVMHRTRRHKQVRAFARVATALQAHRVAQLSLRAGLSVRDAVSHLPEVDAVEINEVEAFGSEAEQLWVRSHHSPTGSLRRVEMAS
jgi:GNAT superfamily N-acetyltransferase